MPEADADVVASVRLPADGITQGREVVLHRGDVLLVTGPSGAGKTRLLRRLAGLDGPGSALVGDADPALLPAAQLARRLAFVQAPARRGLVGLTVAGEARLRGRATPGDLGALAGRDVATLSQGEATGVALALMGDDVPVWLLDEVAPALDADACRHFADRIDRHRAQGIVVMTDPSGRMHASATRRLHLGDEGAGRAPQASPMGMVEGSDAATAGPVILSAPPATVTLGRRTLRLPAVRFGPGIHAVVGRNGAGKTTLLHRLAGLEHADGVLVAGLPPRPGRTATLLLAGHARLLTAATVAEELAGTSAPSEGLPRTTWVPSHLISRHPLSLSAGQAQRVALAKVLAHPGPVLLLDEPEAHLDAEGRLLLRHALHGLAAQGRCIVLATHDPGLAAWAHDRLEIS